MSGLLDCGCGWDAADVVVSVENTHLVNRIFSLLDTAQMGYLDAAAMVRLTTAVHNNVHQSIKAVRRILRSMDREQPHGTISKDEFGSFLERFPVDQVEGPIPVAAFKQILNAICEDHDCQLSQAVVDEAPMFAASDLTITKRWRPCARLGDGTFAQVSLWEEVSPSMHATGGRQTSGGAIARSAPAVTHSFESQQQRQHVTAAAASTTQSSGRHLVSQGYAVKVFANACLSARSTYDAIDEAEIMRRLMEPHHQPHIIQMVQLIHSRTSVYLFMEYAPAGDLYQLLVKKSPVGAPKSAQLTLTDSQQICKQILTGLSHIHSKDIIHRDIKPENILMMSSERPFHIKIADFGLSSTLDPDTRTCTATGAGSPFYLAPERFAKIPYTEKVDLWALGILVFEMICSKAPLNRSDQAGLEIKNFRGFVVNYDGTVRGLCKLGKRAVKLMARCLLGLEIQQLLVLMLQPDASNRPSAASLRGHEWFRMELDDTQVEAVKVPPRQTADHASNPAVRDDPEVLLEPCIDATSQDAAATSKAAGHSQKVHKQAPGECSPCEAAEGQLECSSVFSLVEPSPAHATPEPADVPVLPRASPTPGNESVFFLRPSMLGPPKELNTIDDNFFKTSARDFL